MSTRESETQEVIDSFNQPKEGWFDFCAKMREILTSLNRRLGEAENQEDKQPGVESGDRNLSAAGVPSLYESHVWISDVIEQWYKRVSPNLNFNIDFTLGDIVWHEGQAYRLNFKTGAQEKLDIPPHPRVLLRDVLHQLNNCLAGLAADPPTEGGVDADSNKVKEGDWWKAPDGLCQLVNGEWIMTLPNDVDKEIKAQAKNTPPADTEVSCVTKFRSEDDCYLIVRAGGR